MPKRFYLALAAHPEEYPRAVELAANAACEAEIMRYSYRCRKWNERILKYTLCVEVEQYSSASMTEIRRRQRNSTPVQTLAEMQKMIDGAAQAYFRTIPGKWALIEATSQALKVPARCLGKSAEPFNVECDIAWHVE